MLLKNKVALVTGGGRGIGRAIVGRFAREGARVVLAQRDPESGERTREEVQAAGGEALFVPTDVSQRGQVERLIERVTGHFGTLGSYRQPLRSLPLYACMKVHGT